MQIHINELEAKLSTLSDEEILNIFFANGGTIRKDFTFFFPETPTDEIESLCHAAHNVLSREGNISGRKLLVETALKLRRGEIDAHGRGNDLHLFAATG